MSDVNTEIKTAEDLMSKAVDHLEHELTKVRAGAANPGMLETVRVDYYGSMVPLSQVASVNTGDARTLFVKPWEKKLIEAIEKAILGANLGFNPSNNGESVIIHVPMLTEERRKDLVKSAHKEAEHARVSIRSIRQKAMEAIKAAKKTGLPEDHAKGLEADVEKLTATYNKKVEEHIGRKEKDIMKV
ncbi:MAG: ribosome recycling factor [Flavobacteriales bacterium]|nr:ribosome recycling factor [Flavobacteriales bacterium]MBK6755885.1 ribosome recycling factor [Flavobacteriales bacterium]MBK7270551.1 ribosome recycling factor [Flavobacteriales bacterium]MBK9073896.1 ribosome recycling factor [Flavobacteriales bacterium]MBK9540009.1 ribosome recycling factor [Flavobacteriales bacterium]